MTADTNYTTVLTNAKAYAAQADEDATTAAARRATAEQHLEDMQAAEVDPATLSSQMDLVDRLNDVIWRQQQQIDRLVREVTALRETAQPTATPRSLRDELPPHY